jgi:ABC-type Fe3+/spermidine/putrescine transport system ATPase subunit
MVKVVLEGLIRRFSDGTTVGPINLEIEDGELITLLGPSGSGKTTTLKMIAGFIELDEGNVLFDGTDVADVPPRLREIGMVHQSIALFPNMTVYQNISFGPEMAGWSREQTVQRVEELADLLGIRHLLMRSIDEISGGEAQRVALARALAKEPKLLLLDEPLSALDPQLREKLQMEIRRIQRKVGITTIYVTHSQDEAFAISDRVAILQEGIILQIGTPEGLYDDPKTEFVARFLGSGNVFVGVIESSNGGQSIANVHGRRFRLRGVFKEGTEVRFSVKPEDIKVRLGHEPESIAAELLSVTPQVGSYRITLAIEGTSVVCVTHDEALVRSLRNAPSDAVSFIFGPEDVVVLD